MVEEVDEEGLSTSRYLGDIRIHPLTRGSIQTTMIGEAFSVVAKAILDAIPRFEVLQMMMMKAGVVFTAKEEKEIKLSQQSSFAAAAGAFQETVSLFCLRFAEKE